jgi:hypothetical protein
VTQGERNPAVSGSLSFRFASISARRAFVCTSPDTGSQGGARRWVASGLTRTILKGGNNWAGLCARKLLDLLLKCHGAQLFRDGRRFLLAVSQIL